MPAASPLTAGRVRRVMAALTTAGVVGAVVLGHAHASATSQPPAPTARSVDIPAHFVGLSLEWTLVERYMGPNARPAFTNLLRNLGTGVLRVGGSSQDLLAFEPGATNTNRVITREDLASIRATLDAANGDGAPSWSAILGTAMAPRTGERQWAGPGNARRFTEGVAEAFPGETARDVAGIELGNEPDVSYRASADRYVRDFASFSSATAPFAIVAPNTSEVIAPWARVDANERSWDWPEVLGTIAPAMRARAGSFATGHFYPTARRCTRDAYRCASISRLLSDERMANLRHAVHRRANEAARRGLPFRVEELNSAANRGVHGVSDVAASATWALDAMFNAACPRPGDSSSNEDCGTGAIGVNFHSAEVRAFSFPGEGNAYYNPIRYDPTPAMGAPAAAPEYYALLLFARLAQDTHGLRPVPVSAQDVSAWRVDAEAGERRLFLINKGGNPATLGVAASGRSYVVDRMTPHDPSGRGRTLDAPRVRIDGREVAPDGTWPGFQPASGVVAGGRLRIRLEAGEAAVVRLQV